MAFIVSSLLVLSYENFREFLDKMCRCDGMVDVADSKSAGGDSVWVRVPPPAPKKGRHGARHALPFSHIEASAGLLAQRGHAAHDAQRDDEPDADDHHDE